MSQGWTPGEFLGPAHAPHAEYHTAANSSHIRVWRRDDNLGLGANCKSIRDGANPTGLNAFQDILGRLNGKDESQLAKEQDLRSTIQRSNFVDRRWGKLRFVSGGLLIGDELQRLPKKELLPHQAEAVQPVVGVEHHEELEQDDSNMRSSRPLKRKKSKRPKNKEIRVEEYDSGCTAVPPENANGSLNQNDLSQSSVRDGVQPPRKDQRQAEKTERKLRRKLGREARHENGNSSASSSMNMVKCGRATSQSQEDCQATGVPAPSFGTSRAPFAGSGNRNAVRMRSIQQKKRSMMDSKALNEVGR